MISIFLFFTGLTCYVALYKKNQDKISPGGMFCFLWFSTAALASIEMFKNSYLQVEWELETYVVIVLSGLIFFFTYYVMTTKFKPIVCDKLRFSFQYKIVFDIFVVLSIIATVYRFFDEGINLEKLWTFQDEFDAKTNLAEATPFIFYFEMLTPYLALAGLFEFYFNDYCKPARRIWLFFYVLYALFVYSLVLNISRGTALVIILGFIFIRSRIKQYTWLNIVATLTALIAFLIGSAFIRMNSESFAMSYMGESVLEQAFSSIYTYVAFNFENLNQLVAHNIEPTYIYYSMKFLLWPFLKDDYLANKMGLYDFDTLYFNARTYLYAFYHDLGLIGCLLYTFLISLFISLIELKAKSYQSFYLPLMALQKPIFFAFFGNYFFGELILLVPILFLFFLAYLMALAHK